MRLTEKALRVRIEALAEQQAILGAEHRALTDEAEKRFEIPKKRELIGKCFIFRNSFSGPKAEEDYWWLFVKITDVTEEGNFVLEKFQKDSRGIIEFTSGEITHFEPNRENKYASITSKEYAKARREILKEIG